VAAADYVGIAVPFTVEEIENLTTLAAAQGATLVDLIRARVFGPMDHGTETLFSDDEDLTTEKLTTETLTTLMARIEGMRIRSRGRRRQ
jgi:hypothetical protein